MIPSATSSLSDLVSVRACRFRCEELAAFTVGLLLIGSPFSAVPSRAESIMDEISGEVSAIYKKSTGAIVRVKAQPVSQGQIRTGSGFFVEENGRLLTTATVAANAKRAWIEWQNEELPVEVVGADAHANVALLRVEASETDHRKFPTLPFADSKGLQVGSAVIAIGNPYDLPPSPSFGIVSGFDLHQLTRLFVTSHIRADIALSPGERDR